MRRSKDLFATTLTPEDLDLSLGISELNPAETATFPDGTKGCNALHFAALHSNYPVIGQLFTLGVPFAQNEYKSTPLHVAASLQCPFTTGVIIQYIHPPELIDVKDKGNRTALNIAVRSGNVFAVNQLLQHHADFTITDEAENSYLHIAVSKNSEELIQVFCGLGLINTKNKAGHTALHLACIKGFSQTVNTLLSHGADIEARCESGSTPLQLALEFERTDAVLALLANGANVAVADSRGFTTMDIATSRSCCTCIRALLDRSLTIKIPPPHQTNCLHIAALRGHFDLVKMLLAMQLFDINDHTLEKSGRTAIELAADSGHTGIVAALIDAGANVNSFEGKLFHSPLHFAVDGGYIDIVNLLIQRGANVNAVNEKHLSPLHVAARTIVVGVVEALLDAGADVSAVDAEGNTALHQTVIFTQDHRPHQSNSHYNYSRKLTRPADSLDIAVGGRMAVVDLLCQRGATVDAYNSKECMTALMYACKRRLISIAELLINYGADLEAALPHLNNLSDINYLTEIFEIFRNPGLK